MSSAIPSIPSSSTTVSPTTARPTAWFCGYYLLKNIDGMENLHTDSVKSMNNMFCACSNLYNVDLSHFNTENVEDMSRMFYFSTGFSTLDLSYFNTKSRI